MPKSAAAPDTLLPAEGADDEVARMAIQAAIDLQERGWTVVNNVIPREECEAYQASLWSYLESLGTGIDRADPSTWGDDRFPPTFRGILNTLEIGHQAFVWKIRKNPRLLKIQELLYGTNELLTSFDAINMLGPHQEAPAAGWLHVDQAPYRDHLACIQGIVNLSQVGPDITGTLMVKDKSHKSHQEFFHQASGLTPDQLAQIPDHYQFTAEQQEFFDQFQTIGLSGEPGSVFLWDSRCAHSNTGPEQLKQWRHVVYACYQPRSMASPRDLEVKARAYARRQLTTHLPAQDIRVYDEEFAVKYANEDKASLATGGKKPLEFKISCDRDTVEDSTVLRLAGMEEYPPQDVRHATPLTSVPPPQLRSILERMA